MSDKKSKKLGEYVMTNGIEKSLCTIIDRNGIEVKVRNVICDGKLYFVVSANSKLMECMEI